MICCIWQIRRKTWNNRKGKRMSISRMVYTGTSYFGEYAREKIAEEVSKRHFRKALLISDKALEACGITGKIEEVLKKNGIPYTLFDEVKPNPTIENVRAGLACYKNSGSDFILAVGGGSVIDTAKAVAVTANNPENEDIVSLEGMDKSKNPAVPLIAVPTTGRNRLGNDNGLCYYQHAGKAENGMHGLESGACGGNSGHGDHGIPSSFPYGGNSNGCPDTRSGILSFKRGILFF